uniref:Ribosomal protein L6 n=1 Tax=Mesostigma viride TaxID=41882 RepID=Q8W9R9_MESVI|nr:ribosomal protein L6 [Mesostigma viride]AAL36739.1 ribosomal protein L6 [Mesostigma viride]
MYLPELKEKTILIPPTSSFSYEKIPYNGLFNISFKTSLGASIYFFAPDSFLFCSEKKFALVHEKKKLQNSISKIQTHLKGVEEGICICLELVSKTYYVEVTSTVLGMRKRNTVDREDEKCGKKINLYLGKSHPIVIYLPSHIKVKQALRGGQITGTVTKSTQLLLYGVSKQEITYFASWIKNLRPANCFTGRGIRYKNEKIFLKQKKR